jgi:hypothetical protein
LLLLRRRRLLLLLLAAAAAAAAQHSLSGTGTVPHAEALSHFIARTVARSLAATD